MASLAIEAEGLVRRFGNRTAVDGISFGVVFEEQNLYDRLSARENLRFNCRLFDLPLSRADEALALVGLADRATSPAGSLTTGPRQRPGPLRSLRLREDQVPPLARGQSRRSVRRDSRPAAGLRRKA